MSVTTTDLITFMKRSLLLILILWPGLCQVLKGQPTPVPPATQAEVDAGVVRNKYVSPATLAGNPTVSGGATNGIQMSAGFGTNTYLTNATIARADLSNSTLRGYSHFLGTVSNTMASGSVFNKWRTTDFATRPWNSFNLSQQDYENTGIARSNNVWTWGYNLTTAGLINTADHGFGFNIEPYYKNSTDVLEWYFIFLGTNDVQTRPISGSFIVNTNGTDYGLVQDININGTFKVHDQYVTSNRLTLDANWASFFTPVRTRSYLQFENEAGSPRLAIVYVDDEARFSVYDSEAAVNWPAFYFTTNANRSVVYGALSNHFPGKVNITIPATNNAVERALGIDADGNLVTLTSLTNLPGSGSGTLEDIETLTVENLWATNFFIGAHTQWQMTLMDANGTLGDSNTVSTLVPFRRYTNGTIGVLSLAAPTTAAAGSIGFDNNAHASGRGALQLYDGTANTWLVGTLASDTPTSGQVPTWNTGGTITWESPFGGIGTLTSAQLATALLDEVGGTSPGKAMFNNGPTILDTFYLYDSEDLVSYQFLHDESVLSIFPPNPYATTNWWVFDKATGVFRTPVLDVTQIAYGTAVALTNTAHIRYAAGSSTLSSAGQVALNTTGKVLGIHNGTKEVGVSLIEHREFTFDPATVCAGDVDRLFLLRVGDWAPNGITIVSWHLSFEADPTTEVDLDLKRADAFIDVANSAVMDVLDTTNGASSESTAANINGGAVVANGKVIYLEFGTAYSEANHQMIFSISYEIEED